MGDVTASTPTTPLSSLRPVWLGLPFLPWLALLVPWFAPSFSLTWLVLALYFWPANHLAFPRGVQPPSPSYHAFLLAYCLAVSLLLEVVVRLVGRRRGAWRAVRRLTASRVVVAIAVVSIGIFGYRYLRWIDWPARPAPPDHLLRIMLREHAAQLGELTVYELPGGFLDHDFAVRFRAEASLLPELIDSLALEPVPDDRVPTSFWTGPAAYWWSPPRSGRFYATRDFPVGDRGRDGDHYLLLHAHDEDAFWAWVKMNF